MLRRFASAACVMFACLAAACERVVDLDVPEGPRRLVVEARLERILGSVRGAQSIRLSTTAPYFDAAPPPAARGAEVTVTDDAGRAVMFAESAAAGTYTTSQLVVQAGRRYTLAILYEGQRYESTERAMGVAPIDSLYFDPPRPGRFAGSGGVRATIDLVDPPGVRNFYLWEQYVDGVRLLGPDSTFKLRVSASDDGFDGLPVTGFQPYEGVDIGPGRSVLVRQVGLSESMFRYYFALSDQVNSDGSPFSVPPASVRGNVANISDRSRPPRGYFHVAEVAEARATRGAASAGAASATTQAAPAFMRGLGPRPGGDRPPGAVAPGRPSPSRPAGRRMAASTTAMQGAR